jgi:hypothetical protein
VATSIAGELGHDISLEEVEQRVIDSFANVFRVELKPVLKDQLEGECVDPEAARVV